MVLLQPRGPLGRALGAPSALALLAGGALAFQTAPPPSVEVPHPHDTGRVENRGTDWEPVASFEVRVTGAAWLRLAFDRVELAGDLFAGSGAYLLITSHADHAYQRLDRYTVEQWRNTSAYFNGDAVSVDLWAAPGTGASRLSLASVTAGIPPIQQESQCGPTDDRVLSSDPRSARLLPVGCTGWLIDDCARCFLTAGHCSGAGSLDVVQFNVPLSSTGGSINHPPPSDQYAVDDSSQQFASGGVGADWGYFGTFPNSTTGLTAAEAQGSWFSVLPPPPFNPSADIRITGYGTDSTPATHNQVQQTHAGPWFDFAGTTLEYQTDTTGGNSGSPVIHEPSGVAIGIHTHGGCSSSSGNHGTSAAHTNLQAALAAPRGVCEGGMRLLSDPPAVMDAGQPASFDLQIDGTVLPGSARLRVRYDGGAFLEVPLVQGGGNLWQAVLPPPTCAAAPEFYVEADLASCGLVTLPAGAPGALFSALVGDLQVAVSHDMETAQGWQGGVPGDDATTGIWVRVDPIGTAAQPEDDHTPPPGTQCWVTGQGAPGGGLGDNDVDNGTTTLLSPVLDASGPGPWSVSYWRWYSNDQGAAPGADVFVVDVSNDGGASWTNVEVVGPTGPGTSGGWIRHSFAVADLVAPTAQLRLRFVASDLGSGSIVEAAIDDFELARITCEGSFADCNGNGILDADDIASGRSLDLDGNGVPDECTGVGNPYCFCATGAPCGNPDGAAGCATSTGAGALLVATGSAGVAADDLVLTASGVVPNQFGLLFMGPGQNQVPFYDGLLCVSPGGLGLFRFPLQLSGAQGVLQQGPGLAALSSQIFPLAGQIDPGETWNFQAWFRDPGGPCGGGANTSNGLEVVFVP